MIRPRFEGGHRVDKTNSSSFLRAPALQRPRSRRRHARGERGRWSPGHQRAARRSNATPRRLRPLTAPSLSEPLFHGAPRAYTAPNNNAFTPEVTLGLREHTSARAHKPECAVESVPKRPKPPVRYRGLPARVRRDAILSRALSPFSQSRNDELRVRACARPVRRASSRRATARGQLWADILAR